MRVIIKPLEICPTTIIKCMFWAIVLFFMFHVGRIYQNLQHYEEIEIVREDCILRGDSLIIKGK